MTVGVVCLHGLGGSPATMAPVADALGAAGCVVEVPLLAGHPSVPGTPPGDVAAAVGWEDWLASAVAAVRSVRARTRRVIALGQSLGGSLALRLLVDGLVDAAVCINPVALPSDPDVTEHHEWMIERGKVTVPVGPPDIVDPSVTEPAMEELPIRWLLQMGSGVDALQEHLARITAPVLLVTSVNDSVTHPASSDHLAAALTSASVQRVLLPRSGHVATLDVDRATLIDSVLGFVAAD